MGKKKSLLKGHLRLPGKNQSEMVEPAPIEPELPVATPVVEAPVAAEANQILLEPAPRRVIVDGPINTTDSFGGLSMARMAAIEDGHGEASVGELVTIEYADGSDGGELATFLFEASVAGYSGWRWAVTLARVDKFSVATVCDVVLIPGPDALLAPEWVPYVHRVMPGDVGVGDIAPTPADDPRLVPGFAALPEEEQMDAAQVWELGLGKERTLSIVGRDQASKRWYEGERGPHAPIAQSAPLPCASCGFFIPISGALRSAFGVCANAISPEDGRVVSVDHGCGAHSQALVIAD